MSTADLATSVAADGIPENAWERAVALLDGARDVVLACHVEPDGDALGSMLALARFLRSRGARATASWGRAGVGDGARGALVVPPQYTFLPGVETLVPASEVPEAPEVLVALDTGSLERLGSLRSSAQSAGAVVVVDHHASGAAFGDARLVDGRAAATAVLVDELIARMGGTLDRDMAACLYVGVVTDTARFQHPSTTPEVMRLAARLISYDIDHAAINRAVFQTHSFGYLKVLGQAMQRATLVAEAGLAWTAVLRSDLEDRGTALAETEGLIDVLQSVRAAEVALVAKEVGADEWRVSLRSKGGVDVGRLATRLGGGGHAHMAALHWRGDLRGLVDAVVALVMAGEFTRPASAHTAVPRRAAHQRGTA